MAKSDPSLFPRPPIVAVLGHVDHGKTSLLDAIRNTDVQSHETGGITQHIGAYQIKHQDRLITFIDTPGHSAFTAMRARGGQIADIAILVVAADDGVMPQTKESISHLNTANTPFVVAINKIDLPGADTQKTKTQLAENGVFVEGFGGNIPVVEVSAVKRINLDTLLETLLLLADIQELKADPNGILKAIVIESNLDKRQGPLATVVVKNGTLKPSDKLITTDQPAITAKARSLTDWLGNQLKEALPSTPTQILGFSNVPSVGSVITHTENLDKFVSQDKKPLTISETNLKPGTKINDDNLPLILKTDVVGTLEAITSQLPKNVQLVHSGTGPINESDVLLAETTQSVIFGFRIQPTPAAKKLASIEKISISTFNIIYDLLDALKTSAGHKNKPVETITAEGKVLKVFDFKDFRVIGTSLTSGKLHLKNTIHVKKQDGSIKNATIKSLKVGAQDVPSVQEGQEFGMILNPELDIKPGDDIIGFEISSN